MRLFVSDIEVASDMMDAPAYENFARLGALMHASLWRFRGDPDTLVRAYNELVAELPLENFRFHACLRAPDGMVIVDTCPSKEVFENFVRGTFEEARKRHGLPEPDQLDDLPVHRAFAEGAEFSP